jgi:hypothetical protein
VECALGPPELAGKTVDLRYAGLMTSVRGALGDDLSERKRATHGLALQGLAQEERIVAAPVRTLTEVLADCGAPVAIDLISIDVEGYEVEVLKGLDLERYQPRAICLEVRTDHLPVVREMIEGRYVLKEVLHESAQHGDYLWMRRDD